MGCFNTCTHTFKVVWGKVKYHCSVQTGTRVTYTDLMTWGVSQRRKVKLTIYYCQLYYFVTKLCGITPVSNHKAWRPNICWTSTLQTFDTTYYSYTHMSKKRNSVPHKRKFTVHVFCLPTFQKVHPYWNRFVIWFTFQQ